MDIAVKIKAALGRRHPELLREEPRRRAWAAQPPAALEAAFEDARQQALSGLAGKGFATLLIEHLDHLIGLRPEPPSAPPAAAPDAGGVTRDAHGRPHQPDHDHVRRARARRQRERDAEDAYARAYDEALAAGADDAGAHARALLERRRVLAGDAPRRAGTAPPPAQPA